MNTPDPKIINIYNTQTNSWTTSSMSVAHTRIHVFEIGYFFAVTSLGNLVFFGGGFNNGPEPGIGLDIIDIYNTQNDSWTTSKLSVPRAGLAATSGGGNAGYLDVVDIYCNTELSNYSIPLTTSFNNDSITISDYYYYHDTLIGYIIRIFILGILSIISLLVLYIL